MGLPHRHYRFSTMATRGIEAVLLAAGRQAEESPFWLPDEMWLAVLGFMRDHDFGG